MPHDEHGTWKPTPVNDRFHDQSGSHRRNPPAGESEGTWRSDLRKHLEGHGTMILAAAVAPDIGLTPPRIDPVLEEFLQIRKL